MRQWRPGAVARAAAALLLVAPAASAQGVDGDAPAPGDTVLATPNGRYDVWWVQRALLGDGHRNLWPLPVPALVLDLDTWAGGLTVLGVGGGLQTSSLRFQGADGQEWRFRSVDKDASRALDPELRNTIAADILQDRISALMPMSAAVVAPILEAGGVLHADPTLVVLPDDPRLGEYRADFAGLLGWMEVRPNEGPDDTPGFAGSSRVVGSDRMMERIGEDSDEFVDARSYLRARLIDVFVGDWDRHPDQWLWAGFDDPRGLRFEPVPRDRDWALSRLDGLIGSISWAFWPHYVGFQHDYPSAFRATWSARLLDRWLLTGLNRDDWTAVVDDLASRLTVDVIDTAVSRLPPSYLEAYGDELRGNLRNRQERLPAFAREWYGLLARWPDVHATDDGELARVTWTDDGGVEVLLFKDRDGGGSPFFDRRFPPDETDEVRLYMHGGDDHVVVSGPRAGRVRLHIVGGGGDDVLEDRTPGSGPVHFHDSRGENRFETGDGARVDTHEFQEPFDPSETTHQAPFRDWGVQWLPTPTLTYDPDQGVFVGMGFIRTGYGFRYYPYRNRLIVNAGFGTRPGRIRGSVLFDFPLVGRSLRGAVDLYGSGADANRFYGFGNETTEDGDGDLYHAERREVRLQLPVTWLGGASWSMSFGPLLKHFAPFDTEGTLIDELQPYGFESFTEVGLAAAFELDSRDQVLQTTRGFLVRAEGRAFAKALSVDEDFGGVRGSAAGFFTVPGRIGPTLAVRLGGEATFGDVPYQEAAYVGGPRSLRGYRNQRFAGQHAAFVNSELRFKLRRLRILVPGDVGVYALGDVGRVFVDGESSSVWHGAGGGGAWVTLMDVVNVNLSVAASPESTFFYFQSGFTF